MIFICAPYFFAVHNSVCILHAYFLHSSLSFVIVDSRLSSLALCVCRMFHLQQLNDTISILSKSGDLIWSSVGIAGTACSALHIIIRVYTLVFLSANNPSRQSNFVGRVRYLRSHFTGIKIWIVLFALSFRLCV